MRIMLAGIILTLALSGCAEVETAVDRTARQGAKGVVTQILATRFPAVPKELIEPVTDCVIDNSQAIEIREYARAAIGGVSDTTVDVVRAVLSRPETISCLGGTQVLGGLG